MILPTTLTGRNLSTLDSICFRGQRVACDEWEYGNLFVADDGRYKIATSFLEDEEPGLPLTVCAYDVIPETVGRLTGYTDVDGLEIFEGDIIELKTGFSSEHSRFFGIVRYGPHRHINSSIDSELGFYIEWMGTDGAIRNDFLFWINEREVRVIGNVHGE